MAFVDENWRHLTGRLAWVEHRLTAKGADAPPAEFLPPVAPAQVEEFARATGLRLPADLVDLATKFAGGWAFHWNLCRPDGRWLEPPVALGSFGGNAEDPFLGASAETTLLGRYQQFQEEIHGTWLADRGDPSTLAAMPAAFPLLTCEGGGGDYLILRLDTDPCEVVYLDHERCFRIDREHTIGRGLGDFLGRWAAVGFIRCEKLDTLVDPATRLIAIDSPTARAWVAWLDDPEAKSVKGE